MKITFSKILILLFMIISYIPKVLSQADYIEQFGFLMSDIDRIGRVETVDSIKQLPVDIQCKLNQILRIKMGKLKDKFVFSYGEIIDVDKLSKDSLFVKNQRFYNPNTAPKYSLNYAFTDLALGIKRYTLNIQLDKYGQLIDFNMPNLSKINYSKIISLKCAKSIANDSVSRYGIDTLNYEVILIFDKKHNTLIWRFTYIIESTKNSNSESQVLKNVSINALNGKFLGLDKEWLDSPVYCCSPPAIIIQIDTINDSNKIKINEP